VFKNGQVAEQIVGYVPKEQITRALDKVTETVKA
jgi:thioredoxin-like negative regulator of GroEL